MPLVNWREAADDSLALHVRNAVSGVVPLWVNKG